MQINITITVFRLLGFAKLSRKNRAAKNLRLSGEIAKSQFQRRAALFIAQKLHCKGLAAQSPSQHWTWDSNNYREKTAPLRIFGAAAQSRSLKSNTSQPQLLRKAMLQRICGAAAQSRSPKFSEGRHYLLRKTLLQRTGCAAAQSRSQL